MCEAIKNKDKQTFMMVRESGVLHGSQGQRESLAARMRQTRLCKSAAAGDENFLKISNFFKTAGSNLRLKNKKIIFELKKPWDILSKKINPALLFSEKIATINLQSDALILFSILSDFERFSVWWSLAIEIRTYFLENTSKSV